MFLFAASLAIAGGVALGWLDRRRIRAGVRW